MTTKKTLFQSYIPIIFLSLLLNSCAVSSITTVEKDKIQRPYSRIVVLYTGDHEEFHQLDSTTYQNFLAGKYNALKDIDFTRQINKAFQRKLQSRGTTVIKSTNIFGVNEKVSYQQFLEAIQKTGAQAILIINLKNYWHTVNTTYSSNDSGTSVTNNTEPNASFLSYLVDLKSMKPVWMSKSTVLGVYAGYDTLNNHLARRVYSKLVSAHYINPKEYQD
ncbi:hypothetical protein [Prolixibacter sp. NT017]|uniref:hypothetical protein n=1 Tax=Prolixibacter sp. NT017 TaxID=2652390 RepID=UPI00126DCB99|nr:hypothetical protein [Prolixibacter sp. NT017]GET26113.1 hypothetical protein NT017_24420 [Prolixibacter sp. NT017]